MDSRNAASETTDPNAIEFVRFCYHRRRVGWPELYDEMCAVAGRGLFRGYDADDLSGIGIGFSLFDMPALAVLAARIVAEEQSRRRPVAVRIAADVVSELAIDTVVGEVPIPASAAMPPGPMPAERVEHDDRNGRTFDVPIRLAMAPTGA